MWPNYDFDLGYKRVIKLPINYVMIIKGVFTKMETTLQVIGGPYRRGTLTKNLIKKQFCSILVIVNTYYDVHRYYLKE